MRDGGELGESFCHISLCISNESSDHSKFKFMIGESWAKGDFGFFTVSGENTKDPDFGPLGWVMLIIFSVRRIFEHWT